MKMNDTILTIELNLSLFIVIAGKPRKAAEVLKETYKNCFDKIQKNTEKGEKSQIKNNIMRAPANTV